MSKKIEKCKNETPKIVIAHNYQPISILLLNLFKMIGFNQVTLVNNGDQIIQQCNSDDHTILIVDDDAISETINYCLNDNNNISIIWTTKIYERRDERIICPLCIDEVIKMPFDIWDVLARVNKILPKGERDENTTNDNEKSIRLPQNFHRTYTRSFNDQ
jgi:DNA-binding response OmpR family regulator